MHSVAREVSPEKYRKGIITNILSFLKIGFLSYETPSKHHLDGPTLTRACAGKTHVPLAHAVVKVP